MNKITPQQKQFISDSVHEVVEAFRDEQTPFSCAYYAMLGHFAIERVTGCRDYILVAGAGKVITAPDPGDGKGAFCMELDPEYDPAEYHCWLARPDRSFRQAAEVVDLSARHYQLRAKLGRTPWKRDPVPDFIWGTPAEAEEMKVYLIPHGELTVRMTQQLLCDPLFKAMHKALGAVMSGNRIKVVSV